MTRQPEFRKVQILSSSGDKYEGTAAVHIWTPTEAFWRGLRKSGRIVGIILLCILPFALMEPFAFMLWGSVSIGILVLIVGPVLHLKYWNESTSFEYVTGTCPGCRQSGKLYPYIHAAFEAQFTVLCKECGQTYQAVSN